MFVKIILLLTLKDCPQQNHEMGKLIKGIGVGIIRPFGAQHSSKACCFKCFRIVIVESFLNIIGHGQGLN